MSEAKGVNGAKTNLLRLLRWKYSPSLFLSGVNTVCSVVFQLGALSKLGVGARSDLYYASIVAPFVLYTLIFGALNSVLIPMLVEAKARDGGEEIAVLWNCVLVTIAGGVLLLVLLYYPTLYAFPFLFRKLAWIDLPQVGKVLLAYSVYQILFCTLAVKNCFLFFQGRPVSSQMSVLSGWLVSLLTLWRVHPVQNLSLIAVCLIAGNAVALAFPNVELKSFSYRKGFFRAHVSSLVSRNLPLIVGGSVSSRLEPLLDGVLASFCKEGSLTIFYFFGRIMMHLSTVTFSGYMQPMQKVLADVAGQAQWVVLQQRTKRLAVRATLISLGLLTVAVLLLAFLYLWGFGPAKVYFQYFADDWPVFFLMLGYLLGMVAVIAYSNSLLILRKERLFLLASLAVFPAGILFKFIGAYSYDLRGLALGTSLYWMLNAAVLIFVFSRYLGKLEADFEPSGDGETRSVELASAKEGGY
jgi:hypothetical protein